MRSFAIHSLLALAALTILTSNGELIFSENFESGDLSPWSEVIGDGSLTQDTEESYSGAASGLLSPSTGFKSAMTFSSLPSQGFYAKAFAKSSLSSPNLAWCVIGVPANYNGSEVVTDHGWYYGAYLDSGSEAISPSTGWLLSTPLTSAQAHGNAGVPEGREQWNALEMSCNRVQDALECQFFANGFDKGSSSISPATDAGVVGEWNDLALSATFGDCHFDDIEVHDAPIAPSDNGIMDRIDVYDEKIEIHIAPPTFIGGGSDGRYELIDSSNEDVVELIPNEKPWDPVTLNGDGLCASYNKYSLRYATSVGSTEAVMLGDYDELELHCNPVFPLLPVLGGTAVILLAAAGAFFFFRPSSVGFKEEEDYKPLE